ncbi:DUF4282 domain-containing protein [Actinoallomurus sp. CA-150999]|uniref:DUF4282 domain-containing protein n=1 Tax=Actinoallomurus sp. CA-150999 TaxID=3239887 RepID=UPI003D8F4658
MEAEETEMPNAPDDPGHRPPPPRQGDPQPYQGPPQPPPGGQPPYGAYAPPPNQPPPPAAPWQGPPPGYGPSLQSTQGSPGYPPRRPTDKGFLGALFDLNFDHTVTAKLIRIVYVLSILLISCNSLAVLGIGVWVFQLRNGWFLGLVIIGSSPVIWLFQLVMIRMFLEFVINQFKVTEHLNAIRSQGELH